MTSPGGADSPAPADEVAPFAGWPTVLGPLLQRQDLTREQAAAAMRTILAGDATPAQIAAFVIGLRAKGETIEEVTGFVAAMMDAATPMDVPGPLVDTCGTGGDRSGTFNFSTLAAVVVAAAGARVAKHGNRAATSKCGSADLLEGLGVAIDLPPEGVAACIERTRIGFCFAPLYHPAMRHAIPVRRELGVPTIFNFLGPPSNPARARHRALGVADPRMTPVLAEVLRRSGVQHAWVFHGGDGLDELTTTTSSTVLDVRPEGVTRLTVDPAALGLPVARPEDLLGGGVERNVELANAVLAGRGGPVRDMVLLNAGAALVAADVAADLPAGLETAARAIDDGRARATLDAWAETSQSLAKELA